MTVVSREPEASDTFDCFGASCGVHVLGAGSEESAGEAVARVRRELLSWHARFSRFEPESELSRLNRDPREVVPSTPLMARLAAAVGIAGASSGGLVDGTLLGALERAGYRGELERAPELSEALVRAPLRSPAAPSAARDWERIEVDFAALTISRPPGVELDSGGLAKGLFADALAETLASHAGFAVNCAGDLAIGGTDAVMRPIHVAGPFDEGTLHTFNLTHTGVATSGIGRRSWRGDGGRPSHHLLDPATGAPAFTGVVQATALAPSALVAEIRAKAALLSGPGAAGGWLPDGGVIVLDDGSHLVFEPPRATTGGDQRAGAAAGARLAP